MTKRMALEMEVQDHLGVIALLQDARASKLLAPFQLNRSQFTVLFLLSDDSGEAWTIGGLASHLEMNLPGVSKVVNQLCDKGLLKISADSADRRKKFVALTARGQKKCQSTLQAMTSVVTYSFADWTTAELESFRKHLEKFKCWLDTHRDDFGDTRSSAKASR
ncbi:MAG: MarR family winged helix-turn-helix transcriptional regulator [Pseudomonadales bacterium]